MRNNSPIVLVAAVAAGCSLAGCLGSADSPGGRDTNRNADAKNVELVIASNAVRGGKNEAGAEFTEDVLIPKFVEAQQAKGVTVRITHHGDGSDDEVYKQKQSLNLSQKTGADVIDLDGIWVGEFAQAGYIEPLADLIGDQARVDGWEGWNQIPDSVEKLAMFEGKRYGVPGGTDGRVIYFNKTLFARAGLPSAWQPKSWDEILAAARALKKVPGVIPLQVNAGSAMGEATTMQGVLPLLAGTGMTVHQDGKWLGDSPQLRDVLEFYRQVYTDGLGDPVLQKEAKGRDKSFAEFAANRVGILLESDYFWRGVVEPKNGVAKMPNRDQVVGWALIPAKTPGGGVGGQDFVSMSGGGATVITPNTKYPPQAWELMQFANSAEMIKARLEGKAKITQRDDVNAVVLQNDPHLKFVAEQVLPITRFRPGLAEYPKVSAALQQATADVLAGKSVGDATRAYQSALESAVGADKVAGAR